MWDLPKSGVEPMSPAFAGGFLSTGIRGIKMEGSLFQASEVGDQASDLLLTRLDTAQMLWLRASTANHVALG